MATEIERKFIVEGDFSKDVESSLRIVQGYICADPKKTVRIRIRGEQGFITIKGLSSGGGLSRYEFEKEISLHEAQELLKLCDGNTIDKVRYLITFDNKLWEVDVFHEANEGLIIAEIELCREDETFQKPCWLGKEVTGNQRYYNSMLVGNPFSLWKDEQ